MPSLSTVCMIDVHHLTGSNCLQVKIRHKRIGDDFIPYVTKTEVSSKELPLVDGVLPLGNGRICDHETTPNAYDEDEEDEEEEGKNGIQNKGECSVVSLLLSN